MLTGRILEVPGELAPLSFHKSFSDMHMNKTKFKRNSSLEHYRMICIGRTKHRSYRGLFFVNGSFSLSFKFKLATLQNTYKTSGLLQANIHHNLQTQRKQG